MHDATHQYSDCIADPQYNTSYCGFSDHEGCIPLNGCGSVLIYPYIISWMLITSMVIFNLFIGIVLDAYAEMSSKENILKPENLANYSKCWSKFDPDATHLIVKESIPQFLRSLNSPLGLGYRNDEEGGALKLAALNLDEINGKVHFKDLLIQSALYLMKHKMTQTGNIVEITVVDKATILGIHADPVQ